MYTCINRYRVEEERKERVSINGSSVAEKDCETGHGLSRSLTFSFYSKPLLKSTQILLIFSVGES